MANEKRLIDANALLDLLRPLQGVSVIIKKVLAIIRNCPTVDAVEVVHGRWEYWAGGLARCPVCGYEYTDYLECKNYCPNCGAKMDGGNEDG